MAAFLYRMAHDGEDPSPRTCAEAPFPDVPATSGFCAHIQWLAGTGVTTGYDDGTFRPAAPISRQAMAAFLNRFWNLPVEGA